MQKKSRSWLKKFPQIISAVVLVVILSVFSGCDIIIFDRDINIWTHDDTDDDTTSIPDPDEGPAPTVTRTIEGLGKVECINQNDTDTIACRGIPYAQPPVGNLRWKAPKTVKPWDGVLEATEWPNRAPQPEDGIGLGTISEDCLYVNVTAPAEPEAPLPVMVFLHGGGLNVHTGNSLVYNHTDLPQQGLIMVTVNMRLGAMGYMAHPALTAESANNASGNYGTLDMIEALKWVRDYIHSFGGDNTNVTIFGESGGGSKVISLLTSPLAEGLFHRAIVESGSGSVLYPTRDLAAGEATGVTLQEELGIEGDPSDPTTLAAMRAKTMDEIVAVSYAGSLTVDGWVLQESIPTIFESGNQINVPLMCGAQTRDLGTDLQQSVPALASYMSAIQPDTYVYVFSHLPDNWRDQPRCAAFHGLELPYVFGNIPEGLNATIISYFASPSFCFGEHGYDESDFIVADTSVKLWAQFAKTGNPNYPGIENDIAGADEWPAYAAGEGTNYYLEIADPLKVGTDPASAHIPAPVVEEIEYSDDTYGFTITYPDTMLSTEAAAPAVWRVETETQTGLPYTQAIILPAANADETLVDAFERYLNQQTPAQAIDSIDSPEIQEDINGVTYSSATVINNDILRSEIIGTKINDDTEWIIFEKTQHINFGMPEGILDTVVLN